MNHVVGGVTSSLADSSPLSPEHLQKDFVPPRQVALTGLDDSLTYVKVFGFHNAVSLRVVARDPNVIDTITLR